MEVYFLTVDVFTQSQFQGAQIAVVPDASQLSAEQMMQIAAEFNLWRTVFIMPSEKASKKIRVFNGKREFDFGGHPTLAAIFSIAHLAQLEFVEGDNEFTLEESHGLVNCKVKIEQGLPVFNQFTINASPEYDAFTPTQAELADILTTEPKDLIVNQYKPMLVATEIPYLIVPVDNIQALKAASFNYQAWAISTAPATCANAILLFCKAENSNSADFHCRLLGPVFSTHEDPPVGAAMPAFTGYLNQFEHSPEKFVVERGVYQQRFSYLHINLVSNANDKIRVNIGGHATLSSKGSMIV
ncbi:PhzF family phenazine biosynthesis protein [Catenovulum adriaticum]|uniref:PhzF family phenazine biosynthesis protein n=1 Tax=Catenovulum adriaticum TaxID=2984846 RepID=A0ABY7AIB6_9ALTE|nr:PhzF family phenazine biosynthesis protein [Catenovulum sp. TS8]WAJ68987.1 PhzF family phenazine biosynthesis protein [Catenovulum sp. TS8]